MILPPPIGETWQTWAEKVRRALQGLSRLEAWTSSASASEDGILLWDRENKYPVVSRDGEWKQVILEDGDAALVIASDVTAAAPDTAYALTYTLASGNGISLGTPSSRIVFSEGGEYLLSFSAQIVSSSASDVFFWFWPRINGTDVSGSTIKSALHSNGATTVVARTAIFTVSAGDYLEAMWAVDDTNGSLTAAAATAFAPSAPASTLAITRIKG